MTGPEYVEALDRKIVHALHLDGRASFKVIAGVLGVSDQTVARRYRRMQATGALRVVGVPNAQRLGQAVWLLRIQCVPDAAAPLAGVIARRSDTAWVSLASAGTEIVCSVRTVGFRLAEAPLVDKLLRTPKVVSVRAYCVLRTYLGGAVNWFLGADTLDPLQVKQLRLPTAESFGPVRVSEADVLIMSELAVDGRASYPQLGQLTGWSPSTVQRRVENLRASGALFFDVEIKSEFMGLQAEAVLWISARPSAVERIGREIATHPEVSFVSATTGSVSLVAGVACGDIDGLYDYMSVRLGKMDEIQHLEVAPMVQRLKGAGSLFCGISH
ncbi:Lrp/AsnC family transcriptional regulator [Actinacidiphila bryophytorum]|uniref:Lrp/AsnC family transcriptional regulator n=1 Tax=Actinacidiphila bryophytorum TaxID=1436133 RepID=UPI002176E90C|nr:Lrp/AsnC family transcriptional regulator [Actinacidiphila bryophytorum]UWE10782.1 Lrp/AsnC family transcriptional regulator [Actinacidiphila bryophytorum]